MKTVNELLSLQKIVRERVNELKTLRNSVSTKDIWYRAGETDKTSEPQYDVKAVDKKVAELELFLYKADAAIKQSNAITKIEIVADVDKLLESLA